MPIISFWNNENTETGKTLSIAAIATYMALMHNFKILIVDTEFNSKSIKDCFWVGDREGFVGQINSNKTDISTGIEGLAKAVMSNKSSPEIITNYTKIVFKDRLEVLLGIASTDIEEYNRIATTYKEIINFANKTYDLIFVDLPSGLGGISKDILELSNLVIINVAQKMKQIESIPKLISANPDLFPKNKLLINLGRYDRYSKYNTRNLARNLNEKKDLLAVPYCTQFYEACNEGEVADFFIKNNKITDTTDTNAIFILEMKKTVERIIYRLQELQLNM